MTKEQKLSQKVEIEGQLNEENEENTDADKEHEKLRLEIGALAEKIKSSIGEIDKLKEDVKDPKTLSEFLKKYQWFLYFFVSVAVYFAVLAFHSYTKHFEQMRENVYMKFEEVEKRIDQRLDYIEKQEEIIIENKINSIKSGPGSIPPQTLTKQK